MRRKLSKSLGKGARSSNSYSRLWFWAAVIAALLLFPTGGIEGGFWKLPEFLGGWIDLAAHGFLFVVFGWLLARSWKSPWRAIALGAAYGWLLEVLQIWVPGRSFQLADIVADAVGVGLGVCALSVVRNGSFTIAGRQGS